MWFMVAAYRKPQGTVIPHDHKVFNDAFSKPRVISGHTIGMLKGCFRWLQQIRKIITEKKKSLKQIIEYIEAAIILHNLCVKQKDEVPEDWIDKSDFSDIDDDERAPSLSDDDELNIAVPAQAPSDERRRQLTVFINEVHTYFVAHPRALHLWDGAGPGWACSSSGSSDILVLPP
jgi:mannose-6-phosphate isomerase class I